MFNSRALLYSRTFYLITETIWTFEQSNAIPRVSENTAVLLLPSSTQVSRTVLKHPLLVERNLITKSSKLKRMCACLIVCGGIAGDKLTADINAIKIFKVQKRDKDIMSFCLFIIIQTYSQVRLSLKIALMSKNHMA